MRKAKTDCKRFWCCDRLTHISADCRDINESRMLLKIAIYRAALMVSSKFERKHQRQMTDICIYFDKKRTCDGFFYFLHFCQHKQMNKNIQRPNKLVYAKFVECVKMPFVWIRIKKIKIDYMLSWDWTNAQLTYASESTYVCESTTTTTGQWWRRRRRRRLCVCANSPKARDSMKCATKRTLR